MLRESKVLSHPRLHRLDVRLEDEGIALSLFRTLFLYALAFRFYLLGGNCY